MFRHKTGYLPPPLPKVGKSRRMNYQPLMAQLVDTHLEVGEGGCQFFERDYVQELSLS